MGLKGSVRQVVRKDDVDQATSGGLRRRYGSHLESERRKSSALQRFLHRFARLKRLVSAVRSAIDESRSSGGRVRVARLAACFASKSPKTKRGLTRFGGGGGAKEASESHEGLGNQQVMRLLFEDGRVTGACGQG